jgi:hypothetical protein
MVIGGEGVGPHADLYSLGAVGYFFLSGTPVFRLPSIVEALADHPPPLASASSELTTSTVEVALDSRRTRWTRR